MATDEKVLVFPRRVLERLGIFQGLNFEYQPYVDTILSPEVAMFVSRSKAEDDESIKQIIPYVILVHEDRVLFYVRGKKSGESRLIDRGSFGFGGHVCQRDDSLFSEQDSFVADLYNSAVDREINEELLIPGTYRHQIVAVLNDDGDSVGRVHFGIVHLCRVSSLDVSKRESQITKLAFLRPAEIRAQPVDLERWSSICLDQLDQILRAWR